MDVHNVALAAASLWWAFVLTSYWASPLSFQEATELIPDERTVLLLVCA
jgi:hypothetical protein